VLFEAASFASNGSGAIARDEVHRARLREGDVHLRELRVALFAHGALRFIVSSFGVPARGR